MPELRARLLRGSLVHGGIAPFGFVTLEATHRTFFFPRPLMVLPRGPRLSLLAEQFTSTPPRVHLAGLISLYYGINPIGFLSIISRIILIGTACSNPALLIATASVSLPVTVFTSTDALT